MTCVFVNIPHLARQTGNILRNPNKKNNFYVQYLEWIKT